MDLLLAAGFFATGAGTFAFAVAPVLSGTRPGSARSRRGLRSARACSAAALIAVAPFVTRKTARRKRALVVTVVLVARLAPRDLVRRALPRAGDRCLRARPESARRPSSAPTACSPFSRSSRPSASGCDSAATAVISTAGSRWPSRSSSSPISTTSSRRSARATTCSPSDFLRLLAFGVLLAGVWRAIGHAEFGRAVAEERARVARDIHDGLAQYLFAISAQVSMLESRRRARDDPAAAQGGVDRGAAGGAVRGARAVVGVAASAPFDAALRRYVDFLVADGELDVEMEIDPDVTLAPGRGDRGVPDRAGGARERTQARRRPKRRRLDRAAQRPPRRASSRMTAPGS